MKVLLHLGKTPLDGIGIQEPLQHLFDHEIDNIARNCDQFQ